MEWSTALGAASGGSRLRRLDGGSVQAKLAVSGLILLLVSAVTGYGTWAAFSATTANSGNTFATGSVSLTDNDSGTAMLTLTNANAGDSDTGCIEVTYDGSLPANVRLYGTTGGSGLSDYLELTVTRGTVSAGGFDDCTNFTPDATDYTGAGAGVLYSGTLTAYADDYATGIVDPQAVGTAESWADGETHVYRFAVTVSGDSAAQGLDASQDFTWEARDEA